MLMPMRAIRLTSSARDGGVLRYSDDSRLLPRVPDHARTLRDVRRWDCGRWTRSSSQILAADVRQVSLRRCARSARATSVPCRSAAWRQRTPEARCRPPYLRQDAGQQDAHEPSGRIGGIIVTDVLSGLLGSGVGQDQVGMQRRDNGEGEANTARPTTTIRSGRHVPAASIKAMATGITVGPRPKTERPGLRATARPCCGSLPWRQGRTPP